MLLILVLNYKINNEKETNYIRRTLKENFSVKS